LIFEWFGIYLLWHFLMVLFVSGVNVQSGEEVAVKLVSVLFWLLVLEFLLFMLSCFCFVFSSMVDTCIQLLWKWSNCLLWIDTSLKKHIQFWLIEKLRMPGLRRFLTSQWKYGKTIGNSVMEWLGNKFSKNLSDRIHSQPHVLSYPLQNKSLNSNNTNHKAQSQNLH